MNPHFTETQNYSGWLIRQQIYLSGIQPRLALQHWRRPWYERGWFWFAVGITAGVVVAGLEFYFGPFVVVSG